MNFGLDLVEKKKDIEDILAACPGKEIAKNWLNQIMMEI